MRDVYIGPIKAVLDFLDNSTMDFILCVSKDNLSKPAALKCNAAGFRRYRRCR